MLGRRCLTGAVVFLLVLPLAALAQKQTPAEQEVRDAMDRFIKVFTHLEWDAFIDSFADDATVFFPPSAGTMNRASGKSEIGAVFKKVFESFRKRRPSAPFFFVEPRDMKVQVYDRIAIVTFHVDENSRRTLVFRKAGKRWLVVHLHGSAVIPAT